MPIKTLSSSKPKAVAPYLPAVNPVAGKLARRGVTVKVSASSSSSSSAVVEGESSSMGFLERCFVAPPATGGSGLPSSSSSSAVLHNPVMKGQYGAFGAVTLEKGKLDMSKKQSQFSPEVIFFLFFFTF